MGDLSSREIRAIVDRVPHWHQRIPLPGGLVTPGQYDPSWLIRSLELGNLRGRRVLDVGTCDGLFAFECERRGADVVAVDHKRVGLTGFDAAKRILGSKVEYLTANVYDLRPADLGHFDLVLFLGGLYHVRHPLLALDTLRALATSGGEIAVESLVCDERLFVGFGKSVPLRRLSRRLRRIPIAQFLPMGRYHGDVTNKWSPNVEGLCAMIEDAGYAVDSHVTAQDRALVRAHAVNDPELIRHNEMDQGYRDVP